MRDLRAYQRNYRAARREYEEQYPEERAARQKNRERHKAEKRDRPTIGIDGEGYGEGAEHRYRYMAAVYASGVVASEADDVNGLSSRACLDALVVMPKSPLVFGFALGYDITFWLRDVPPDLVWSLTHPETRQSQDGMPFPVRWWPEGLPVGYKLNLLQGRFDVARLIKGKHKPDCRVIHAKSCKNPHCVGIQRVKLVGDMPYLIGCRREPCHGCLIDGQRRVWDFFKFFQSSFLAACTDWGVISKEEACLLEEFKKLRGSETFRARWDEVKAYCRLECQKAAELARRLIDAHNDAGLTLKSYYGAGSTGNAMLTAMNAQSFMKRKQPGLDDKKDTWETMPMPAELTRAIASAFFGGRFELSRRGPVRKPVHSADIASAYPYQFAQLPCLVHGTWRHVKGKGLQRAIERSTTAVVHYKLPFTDAIPVFSRKGRVETTSLYQFPHEAPGKEWLAFEEHRISRTPWGPFPMRHADGCITFPVTSGGGWVWKAEFLAGQRFAPNVEAVQAWVYSTECACDVFRKRMPDYYKLRVAWGKEGRGIVLKLGCNSCPGKTAQSKGTHPKFQNFVWAGMVNAGTRSQLLDAIALDRENVLATATDGILSLRAFEGANELAEPIDTGTAGLVDPKGIVKAPLGGWEVNGAWEAKDRKPPMSGVHLVRPGVLFPLDDDGNAKEFKARGVGKAVLKKERVIVLESWEAHGPRALTFTRDIFWGMRSSVRNGKKGPVRDKKYGTWEKQPVHVSYEPEPKRPWALKDDTLLTWAFGPEVVCEAYDPAIKPAHVRELQAEKILSEDQPDVEEGEDAAEL